MNVEFSTKAEKLQPGSAGALLYVCSDACPCAQHSAHEAAQLLCAALEEGQSFACTQIAHQGGLQAVAVLRVKDEERATLEKAAKEAAAWAQKQENVKIDVSAFDGVEAPRVAEVLALALGEAVYRFERYKKEAKPAKLQQAEFYHPDSNLAAALAVAEAQTYGMNIAKDLGNSGSAYSYAYLAFGELIAFVIGWDLILEYALQAATVSAGWSGYFNKLLEGFGLHLPVELTAAYGTTPGVTTYFNLPGFVIVLIITWVLSIGINQTKKTNDIMVMIKLAIIVLFIVCTVWYINPANWKPFSPYGIYTFQPGSTQPYGIVPAASIVFFSFIGFDAVSSSAEETINPNKTLPRGILISLAVSTVLYIIMTLIMTGVVPYKEFAKFIDAPVAGVILETGLNWLAFIVNLGALIGMTTVMLVQLYGQSRICYAMSRDGLFPKFFGEVHPKYRTPFKGTWFFGILTAIAGGFININVLFELVNIGTLSAFIIVSAGILWMRKTQPDAHRGFRAPGVPFTPICAIIFCLILIFGLNWETWVRFAVWFALGLVVYFTYSRKHSQLNEPGLF